METPLISIIIPAFNREKLITVALNSVIAQSYSSWECIVVDDGSTDNTISIVKQYQKQDSRISFFERLREPKGAPTCRNIGLEHAQGDYVVYLDSDDYILPFCLEQRVQAIFENTDCDFLVFPMGKQKEQKVVKVEIPQSEDYLVHFLSAVLPWSIMCPIWNTNFLKKLNGFTEGYPRFNDPELMIRALLKPQVNFTVFHDAKYDTVYLPSPKTQKVFNDKVFKSLCMLIPNVVKQLDEQGKSVLKRHLSLYLHLWFKYIYEPKGLNLKQSIQLINLFKREKIISIPKSFSLKLRLFIFNMSNMTLKEPINKLSEKALYL